MTEKWSINKRWCEPCRRDTWQAHRPGWSPACRDSCAQAMTYVESQLIADFL